MKWTRKNGETIDMKDMSDPHLYNSLKLTRRRLEAGEYLWTVGPNKKVVIPMEMFEGLKAEAKRREAIKKETRPVTPGREPLTIAQLTEVGMHMLQNQVRKFHGPECTCVEDAYREANQKSFDWEEEIETKVSEKSKPWMRNFAKKVRAQAKEEERAEILDLVVNNLFEK